MIAKVKGFALSGLEGVPVQVETDINKGLPSYEIVGLPDAAVRESKERVRSAIKNSGFMFPVHKIIVNLAPADIKKEGSGFDLPVSLALLKASEQLKDVELDEYVYLGELGLDGTLRKVEGILPILISARNQGYKKFILPEGNKSEAQYIAGIFVYCAKNLNEVVAHLKKEKLLSPVPIAPFIPEISSQKEEFSYIKGQAVAKRALEIAVSGGHNILLIGPPGTGKTMLAKAIPSIMPALDFEEALEITKIHSVAGILNEDGIIRSRPFRSPHHTATTVSICGGGIKGIRPGEISLAHGGVLFLDELPEYARSTLEAMRQPLEDGVITIARAGGTVTYPASFMLCASMNPCPCGNYGSDKPCTCSPSQIRRYRAKISGPLLDRIDLQVEVDSVKYADLVSERKEEDSETIKKRVDATRNIQRKRFVGKNIRTNSEMGEREIKEFCVLSLDCQEILKKYFEQLHLSARGRSRVIKVARTIADLEQSLEIKPQHLIEALSYRINEDPV